MVQTNVCSYPYFVDGAAKRVPVSMSSALSPHPIEKMVKGVHVGEGCPRRVPYHPSSRTGAINPEPGAINYSTRPR